jgi:phosphatidylinositol-3-phosphatase
MKLSLTKWFLLPAALVLGACGGGASEATGGDGGHGTDGSEDANLSDGSMRSEATVDSSREGGADVEDSGVVSEGSTTCGAPCPHGYTCGTANGKPVCRAPSGIPMFSHIFLILMENTSLSTLTPAMSGGSAPNLAALAAKYATGSAYHGVSHPSLPNYIALTSGGTQGVGCDCHAQPGQGSCNIATCNLALGSCTCDVSATNLADQIEGAKETWMAFGEGMSTPCNDVDDSTTQYAVRHVPFIYYDDIQTNATRCNAHVVDFSSFAPDTAPQFTFIAPNLTDDMHDPIPATTENITNGDKWIGPEVAKIMASSSYTDGGLIIVVWDEDDDSGGITGTDDPVPIFVLSPYAKAGGYVSAVEADHYSLLATIEDAMALARLGSAGMTRPMKADTLADFFPSK